MNNTFKTLKELCIDYICNNKECLLIMRDKLLPMELSEMLLTELSIRNNLDDEILSFFNDKNVCLRNVILPVTKNVTPKGLRILYNHKIKRLEVYSFMYSINILVDSLSQYNIECIVNLCVSNIKFEKPKCICGVSRDLDSFALAKFKNLHILDVSDTAFGTLHLFYVLKDLPQLESLNISHTDVDSFSPFKIIKSKLRVLIAYNLKEDLNEINNFASLKYVTSLTHLDLSFDTKFKLSCNYGTLMNDPDWLPNLITLDISGSDDFGSEIMEKFLNTHQNLKFLGLMKMKACELDIFTNSSHPLFNPDLLVSGSATKEQLAITLKRYSKRPFFVIDCLNYVSKQTENIDPPRVEIIQFILDVMHYHSHHYLIQLSAISKLVNLVEDRLTSKIDPSVLVKVVEATLHAMECFPNTIKLLTCALYILSNARILLNPKIDRFKCVRLVLNTLHVLNDNICIQMSIIIISILAPKIPFSEIYHQKHYSEYMFSLILIIAIKVSRRTDDLTMKTMLSALNHFTGESSNACKLFIDQGGLNVFVKVFNTFKDNHNIHRKALGVLKNIVEGPHIRIIFNDLIPTLRHLLQSEHIVVSYYAAEIIAHLACEPSWETYSKSTRYKVFKELGFAMKRWMPLNVQLAQYKSFKCFIGLLNSTDKPEIQLFATWAIYCACTNNANKYCAMLDEEIGVLVFQNMLSDESVDQEVRELCNSIVDIMNKKKN